MLTPSLAQEGNNWYFGRYAGLSFNYPTPKALHDGALSTYEGCATISDKNGLLLFYTDGTTVWNKNHQPMPNGTGLHGDSSSANAAIIIPKPGSATIYYIFTADSQENQNAKGYNYSEVDITLDNGLGDITVNKNVLLYAPSSEKLTAVRDANGTDVWIITHEWGSNTWRSFKVSCNGVNTTSVNSSEGWVYQETRDIDGTLYHSESAGCLKASPDGKKIATTDLNSQKWELFDFDNTTGKISNGLNFFEFSPYGIEFSPNSKLVYVSSELRGYYDSSSVKQFVLAVHDSAAVASSAIIIGTIGVADNTFSINALQLGPDDKIYCVLQEDSYLSVINSPNIRGLSCNYVNRQIDLEGKIGKLGLPVFFASLITNKNVDFSFTAGNDCATVDFSASSSINNITQWLWDFGDGQTATGQNVSHTYITGSEYNAQLTVTVSNICGGGTASTIKKINLKRLRPTSAFSFNTRCGDKTLTLIDSSTVSTGNIVQWNWDFGDGSISNLASPTHTFSDFGKYDVSLITTSDGACNGNDTIKKTVALHARPVPDINISNACVNKKVSFTDISTILHDTIAARFWEFDDGQQFAAHTFERQFGTANTYTLKMAIRSSAGCSSDTLFKTFTIDAIPQAKFSIGIACVDSVISFRNESETTNGNITQWHWELGDGNNSDEQNVHHKYATEGNYTIKLIANTSQQCSSDTLIKMIQVDSRPTAVFSVIDGCIGKAIVPENNSTTAVGNIAEYLWDTGQGFISGGEKPSFSFNAAGDQLIRMRARSTQGCASAITEQTINIQSNPVAIFTFGNTCAGEEIQFTNTSSNSAGAIEKWNWDFGNGSNSQVFEPVYVFNSFGIYNVSLTATTQNGCSNLANKTITIAKVNVSAGNDTLVAIGQPLQLAGSGAKDYQWHPITYLNNPLSNSPIAILPADMSYYLTGTTTEGCIGHDTINIKVYKGPDIYVPNAFTPNGDKTNDVFKPVMPGIKQLMYFSVYNRWGQLVYQTTIPGQGWDGMLNGKTVPAGIYIWTLSAIDYNNRAWKKNGSVVVIR